MQYCHTEWPVDIPDNRSGGRFSVSSEITACTGVGSQLKRTKMEVRDQLYGTERVDHTDTMLNLL